MIKDFKSEFFQLIYEYKKKPALLVSKIYLRSKTDKLFYEELHDFLQYWIELLCETDALDNIQFGDVYRLAIDLKMFKKDEPEMLLGWFLHEVRTTEKVPTDQAIWFLNNLEASDPKTGICKCFCYIALNNMEDAFIHLEQASKKESIDLTRSILLSFSEDSILCLKEKLVEGRIKSELKCECNSSRKFAFSSSLKNLVRTYSSSDILQETSFISKQTIDEPSCLQVCNLHRILTELDDIYKTLRKQNYDGTPIYNAHLKAGRTAHALHFLRLHTHSIDHDITLVPATNKEKQASSCIHVLS